MGKYLISVVTPYHNVDHKMFDGCVESMESQTIGFENVEWVIVLHNCGAEYIDYAREKLGGYENVILKELNNDRHTASSPRNAALDLATSDYVAFLDGDDRFRNYTLEKLVGYFRQTNAQVLVFRREYELEFPDMLAISETVPWDTTREIIMPDVRFGMDNRTYNDFPFFVTSRAFDLNFLRENNVKFNESIVVGEDVYFNLETIHLAERICFLPQLIGYIYFINSKSAISGEKSDEEIMNIVHGFQKLIESALDYGLFADNIIIANAFVLCRYISAPNVKQETRLKVRDIFEPYLKMTSPIPEGRFIEPFNTMMNVLPYEILLNPKRFENTRGDVAFSGYDVLAGILKENAGSHFGRRYHFADILSPRGYQSQLPISDIRTYQPMIDVEKSIGDTNVYSSKKPAWYIRMINDMLIPVSANQAEKYADAFYKQLYGQDVLVWAEDEAKIESTNSGTYISSVAGITISAYRRKYRVKLDEFKRVLVIPQEVFFNMDETSVQDSGYTADRTYLKLLFAAADRDVDQIVVFGSHDLSSLKDGLFANLRKLADDIEAGTHVGGRNYHKAYLRTIASRLHHDPERAAELRALAEDPEGFTLNKVWKDLREITVISIHPTSNTVPEFDGITLRCSVIANEAGVIGVVSEEEQVFTLVRDSIFYEFMPADASSDDRPLLADALHLHIGERMRPIVTTGAGLYRVPLNIMIKVIGIKNGEILFKICR